MGGSETVVLDLIAGKGYNVDTDSSTATVTIFNNDLPTVSIVADEPDARSRARRASSRSARNGLTGEPLLVNYTIGGTDLTAGLPDDSGQRGHSRRYSSTATIPIDPLDVGSTSGSTSVVLTLAAGSGYVIADPRRATR